MKRISSDQIYFQLQSLLVRIWRKALVGGGAGRGFAIPISVKVVGLGPEFSQSDMKYDGDSFQLRDQSVNTGNQISIGATGGNLSGEVSFNLDAVKETISKGVDAVKEYVKNLLPTTIWEH